MTKVIGVIAEDDSDVDVISHIFSKYMPKNSFRIKKFTGNGCGKLRNKCDSWASALFKGGCDHVFVFHDLDRNNEEKLRKILEEKVPPSEFPNSLIVIPIEELEAWLLSDASAIQKTFSLPKPPKDIGECELVTSPKEHLEELVWKIGKKRYLNTVHNKKLSEHISLANLRRCASFSKFDKYVIEKVCKAS